MRFILDNELRPPDIEVKVRLARFSDGSVGITLTDKTGLVWRILRLNIDGTFSRIFGATVDGLQLDAERRIKER